MDPREFILACVFVGAIVALVVAVGVLVWRMVMGRPEDEVMGRMTLLDLCGRLIGTSLVRLGRAPNALETTALEAMAGDAARTAVDFVVPPVRQQPVAAQPAAAQPAAPAAGNPQHVVIDVNVNVNAGQGVNVHHP